MFQCQMKQAAEKIAAEQVENTVGDSFELYYGLFMYNPNATEEVTNGTLFDNTCKKEFKLLLTLYSDFAEWVSNQSLSRQ